MSNDINESLSKAYDLIEADRLQDARAILEPILERNQENTDAWWLYVHALQDPEKAREALTTITRLDPDYPGAAELVRELGDASSGVSSGASTPRPPRRLSESAVQQQADDILATLDDDFSDFDDLNTVDDSKTIPQTVAEDDDFGDFGDLDADMDAADEAERPQKQPAPRASRLIRIGLVAALILIVLIVVLLLLNQDGGDDGQPTQIAAQPTATSVIVVAPEETEAAGEASPTTDAADDGFSQTATAIILEATLTAEAEITETIELPDPTENEQVATEEASSTPEPVEPSATESVTIETETSTPTIETVEASPTVDLEQTATALAQQSTEVAANLTNQPQPTTEELPTEVFNLLDAFREFTLFSTGSVTRSTTFGETLLINVCAARDATLKTTLDSVMFTLAEQAPNIVNADAVGASLINCETEEAINVIAVPYDIALAFGNSEVTERDFRGAWRAVG